MGVMKALIHRAAGATVTGNTIALTDPTGVYQVFIREGGSDPSDDSEAAGDRTGWAMVSGGDNAAGYAFTVTDAPSGPVYGPGVNFPADAGLATGALDAAAAGGFVYLDFLHTSGLNLMYHNSGGGSDPQALGIFDSNSKLRGRLASSGGTYGDVRLNTGFPAGTRIQAWLAYLPGTPMQAIWKVRHTGAWQATDAAEDSVANALDLSAGLILGCNSVGNNGPVMTLYRCAIGLGSTIPDIATLITNETLLLNDGSPAAASALQDYCAGLSDCDLVVDVYGSEGGYNAATNQGSASLTKIGSGTFADAA